MNWGRLLCLADLGNLVVGELIPFKYQISFPYLESVVALVPQLCATLLQPHGL